MEIRPIFFIVNPAAGQHQQMEKVINEVFAGSDLEFDICVLKDKENAGDIVRQAIQKSKLVAVCGGDGSITEVAACLIGASIPLAIIPCGTANVLSKELGIPQAAEDALRILRDGQYALRTIDTGLVNSRAFLLRVNLGIMANMIINTDPELKDKIGQFAYGITTVKSIREAEPVCYKLNIDGKNIEEEGVALTITNSGSVGISSLQLQPGISVSDGLLDIVLMKDSGILSVIKAVGSSLLSRETDAISHWTGKEITVTLPGKQLYLCDDCEAEASQLIIKIVPSSLTVAVPISN